ncbi:MetQ/NlpA family ABC transporter substrate-binding protein [Sporosarcina sp. 179-K 3D1 HS]|uniref:MetQ/NlpA family ABC transporter substrate-binding protein n=1 Tax=Sporosarcina sp. 179-K 3D1 HS TaxID=3232169 RepID=UPI0039A2ECE0
MMKRTALLLIMILLLASLGACNGKNAAQDDKTLLIGTTGGSFNFLLKKAVIPGLKEKGYQVSFFEYKDIDELNDDLLAGEIDLNLFQHEAFLDNLKRDKGLPLSAVIDVPTEPIGLFSEVYDSLDEIEEGATLTVPNDPVNLPVALGMLQEAGLIALDAAVDASKATEEDIVDNPKDLQIQPILLNQLPVALQSAELSVIPGAMAISSDLDLKEALALEEVPDQFKNIFVVATENEDAPYVKDLAEVIQSKEFAEVIRTENIYYVEKKKE